MGGGEERQVAQFSQHAAQFRLKNNQHSQDEKCGEGPQEVLEHF